MKIRILPIAAALCAVLAAGCGEKTEATFENPVVREDCPDPTILDNRERDGYFYMASTRTRKATMPVYKSKDLVNWEYVGDGLPDGTPKWQEGASFWAPDMNYINGQYVVYYTLGVWADGEHTASGVAVADSPAGPYKDKGMLVSLANTGVNNAIDANYFEDNGHKYLYYGNIYVIELTDDGLAVKEGSKPVKVSGFMEGAYAYRRGKYVYLFGSAGGCCDHENSNYRIAVGRSESPLGPFVNRNGVSLLKGRESEQQVLNKSADGMFIGSGHNAEIVTDDKGQDWMMFHTYWKGDGYVSRDAALGLICWDEEGWPYFQDSSCQSVSPAPVFKKKK